MLILRRIKWIFYGLLFCSKIMFKKCKKSKSGETYVICISPWYETYIPFFQILIFLFFNNKGSRVLILNDDVHINLLGKNPNYQKWMICLCLKILKSNNFQITNISKIKLENNIYFISDNELNKFININYSHANKSESNVFYFENLKLCLTETYARLSKFVEIYQKYSFIIPGGKLGNFGLLTKILSEKKRCFVTYDSGLNKETLFCYGGIAAELNDINTFFEIKNESLNAFSNSIKYEALSLLNSRIKGNDSLYGDILNNTISYNERNDILILPNVAWDTASLGLNSLFEKQSDWILKTIAFILENTNKKIVLRFHPSERNFSYHSYSSILPILKDYEYKYDRFQIIYEDSRISTYNLIENSNLILTYCSTVTLEALLFEKNVIVAAKSYFIRNELNLYPKSKELYFEMIACDVISTCSHINKNYVYWYYLFTQKYSRVISKINPSLCFQSYIKESINNIIKDKYFNHFEETLKSRYNSSYNSFLWQK